MNPKLINIIKRVGSHFKQISTIETDAPKDKITKIYHKVQKEKPYLETHEQWDLIINTLQDKGYYIREIEPEMLIIQEEY